MKYWSDKHRTLYNGNCRSMHELADNSIRCCVTSPPYWGLRKYAGEQDSIWGGTPDCSHEWGEKIKVMPGAGNKTPSGFQQKSQAGESGCLSQTRWSDSNNGNYCSLCGAWRGAYGLEPTVEMYVAHSIEILREIRRVLRKDGVCFWNVGDSYATVSGGMNQLAKMGKDTPQYGAVPYADGYEGVPQKLKKGSGLKHKDLCLIPFRVAIAAQEDGWWIRSVIIWNKPNPMPESVTDRPTGSHEYILMLTKSPKYYWDMEAVREESVGTWNSAEDWATRQNMTSPEIAKGIDLEMQRTRGFGTYHPDINRSGRNLRNVWTFPTQPYREAHFATFPEALPERCIKAATPEVGCCSKCGKPWERVKEEDIGGTKGHSWHPHADDLMTGNCKQQTGEELETYQRGKTIGWQPACSCNADKAPSIVLDPFCGSGTTLEVAAKLNRHAVGYELSEEYCRLIVERNNQSVLL